MESPLLIEKKVRLISIVGHGQNLIDHFINHYKDMVDEILFVVYESEYSPNLLQDVKNIIKNYNNVKIIKSVKNRVYDWERVTLLYNMVKSEHPNDWWVISDIDEFHLYPENDLRKLINECEINNWDIVRGGFIDRIGTDGEFVEIDESNIWEKFPNAGFFRYPMSQACPNKICAVKGYIEITPGQHYAKIDNHTTWRWQGWNHPLIAPIDLFSVQVHHFKWDKTSIDRIKSVADANQEYAYSKEYNEMYRSLRKSRFKIKIDTPEYFFEKNQNKPDFKLYKNWNKLIKKIISI